MVAGQERLQATRWLRWKGMAAFPVEEGTLRELEALLGQWSALAESSAVLPWLDSCGESGEIL